LHSTCPSSSQNSVPKYCKEEHVLEQVEELEEHSEEEKAVSIFAPDSSPTDFLLAVASSLQQKVEEEEGA
jgi:hypothetical protein